MCTLCAWLNVLVRYDIFTSFASLACSDTSSEPAPIAFPIAKLLDRALGSNEAHTYKKAELKSFLQFHRTGEEPLRDDEISILNGVLELNTKNVETIMTPIRVSFSWAPKRVRVGARSNTKSLDALGRGHAQRGYYSRSCYCGHNARSSNST
jgi:CBS domain containing-hemolysin-like protein